MVHGSMEGRGGSLWQADAARAAACIDGSWPLTHSALQTILPLYDPEQFFAGLRPIIQASPEPLFREAIERVLVDNVFEVIGKIRDAHVFGTQDTLPALVVKLAQNVAMVVGLANRHCYTTATRALPEAMALPDLPDGFGDVAHLVLAGVLRDGQHLVAATERLWQGLNVWADGHGYRPISPERIPF
jgi:kanamycin nucleotidyltransferase